MKKKIWILFGLAIVFAIPQQSMSQTLEDYYNTGYILGASIRKVVDDSRARKAEQERIEWERRREREEADRAYELEQQRIDNERYAIQQREAEARRAEEERLRIANEAKKAEEERLRIAQEAKRAEEERLRLINSGSTNQVGYAANENREYNSNVQILSRDNDVKFLTDEGESILLTILSDVEGDGCFLAYHNTSYKERRLICNHVTIKVKYLEDDEEETLSEACSIVFKPTCYDNVEWSDVFFGISEIKTIEKIRIRFIGTQIR